VGKIAAAGDRPGFSASAEGRRARRSAARRGPVTAALALVAATAAATGAALGHRGLIVGGLAAGVGAWWWRPAPDPERWQRGAEGEVATARLLAGLPRRFVVLHDRRSPGGRGNVDHIVIGRSGVWVVDSKVRRARLRVRRGQVWASGHQIEVAPVAAQAARVRQALGVPVTALVAVHGRGLRRRGAVVDDVRILPASRLTRRLRRGRRLPRRDVAVLAAAADRLFPRC
jgi:Nuclease-related domain